MRETLGWTNEPRSKVNGMVEGEEKGWVFSQPAPLSSFSLKMEQRGLSRMSPRTWGLGTEHEPHIRRWRRREGTARASRQAAKSNLHLKLNLPPYGTQIKTSYLCSPSLPGLGNDSQQQQRRQGGHLWLIRSEIYKLSLRQRIWKRRAVLINFHLGQTD